MKRKRKYKHIYYPATSRASCSYMRKSSMKRRNMIRINEEVSQRINEKEKLLQFYIIMKDTDNKHNKVTRVTNICWGDADAKNTFFLMSGRRSAAAAAARWLFSFFLCVSVTTGAREEEVLALGNENKGRNWYISHRQGRTFREAVKHSMRGKLLIYGNQVTRSARENTWEKTQKPR